MKANHQTRHNKKGTFQEKKRSFTLFWVVLEIKTAFLLHFKRSSPGKWIHIFPRLMVVMLHSC